mmetsp:Transcript_51447/g.82003  ORF Transcript_51447/g.82003 Transcript_51447/m.82003 type:complete len:246 (-) Transcript_51447:547-1284(-)
MVKDRIVSVVHFHFDDRLRMILLQSLRVNVLHLAGMDNVCIGGMEILQFLWVKRNDALWMVWNGQMVAFVVEISRVAAQRAFLADFVLVLEHEAVEILEPLRDDHFHLFLRHVAQLHHGLLWRLLLHQRFVHWVVALERDQLDAFEADNVVLDALLVHPHHLRAVVLCAVDDSSNFVPFRLQSAHFLYHEHRLPDIGLARVCLQRRNELRLAQILTFLPIEVARYEPEDGDKVDLLQPQLLEDLL